MEKKIKKFSEYVTNWVGTPGSILAHTLFFVAAFMMRFFGVSLDDILLLLTTVVSLEAIYLAIFIQMTVNRHAQDLEEVGEDIEEISKDVEEISKDMDEISQDIDKIQEDDREDSAEDEKTKVTLEKIEAGLQKLLQDIETLKQQK